MVGRVDLRAEREQDRVERELGDHLRDALGDPRPADEYQLLRDDEFARGDELNLTEWRPEYCEEGQRTERVGDGGCDGNPDDGQLRQWAETEGEADGEDDVQCVDGAVDVHWRLGVAGPLDRPGGDEVGVNRRGRDHDNHEVGAPVADHGFHRAFLGERPEHGDCVLVEQESEQNERDPAEETDQHCLRDRLISVRRRIRARVLTREGDRTIADPDPESKRKSRVDIRESDGCDRGGGEKARDDQVRRPHQRPQHLFGHHRPREAKHAPPDAPESAFSQR